jgi:hypothetical protein
MRSLWALRPLSRCCRCSAARALAPQRRLWLGDVFSKERTLAPEGYNRLLNVPFSFMVQLSVGSVYGTVIVR